MVLKGQFLERATLVQVGSRTLEALWHRGDKPPAGLLVPPLPGQGSMDAAALNEIAFAMSRAGHPTLRFNFGGVGASQDPKGKPALLTEARAAAAQLADNVGFEALAVVGFRSGAEVAMKLAGQAQALVLISPPAGLDLGPLDRVTCPVLLVAAFEDPQRTPLSELAIQSGYRLNVIENADMPFNRGLPQLGKAVVEFLQEIGG